MFDRFTDLARKVMQFANQEAMRRHHKYIQTEDILLGMVELDSGFGVIVLKNLEIDLSAIRHEVEKLAEPESSRHLPQAKKVIENALEEARKIHNHHPVGTEHILIGLLREKESVAGSVLKNLGLTLEDLRNEVRGLHGCADEDQRIKPY